LVSRRGGWLHRLVRPHVKHQSNKSDKLPSSTGGFVSERNFWNSGEYACWRPGHHTDTRHRCDSIFEAMSPVQATAPYQGFLLSVGTKHSPATSRKKRENSVS